MVYISICTKHFWYNYVLHELSDYEKQLILYDKQHCYDGGQPVCKANSMLTSNCCYLVLERWQTGQV